MQYVALLRGVNVGGRNAIRMPELRACLEKQGFDAVATYIQSGNVVFATGNTRAAVVTRQVERALASTFGFGVSIVLRSRAQLQRVVAEAPPSWRGGSHLRRNVAFLRPPLTARQALADVETRDGVDAVDVGPGVLYLSTSMSALTSSRFNKLAMKPVYKQMTIRTYGTCQRILELMA